MNAKTKQNETLILVLKHFNTATGRERWLFKG